MRSSLFTLWSVAAIALTIPAGCSSSDGPDPSPSSSSSSSSSSGSGSGAAEPDAPATEAPPAAAGPKLVSVAKMMGALHVTWTLPDACDGIELERKDGDAAFAVAFELPGTVDNKHDVKATADMVYAYRARCRSGDTYSAYSNEMSRNPQK